MYNIEIIIMGLIVHDNVFINESAGLKISNFYVNLGSITIERVDNLYTIRYFYNYYVDKQSRENGKEPLLIFKNEFQLNSMVSNLYNYVYGDLKSKFGSYSDD